MLPARHQKLVFPPAHRGIGAFGHLTKKLRVGSVLLRTFPSWVPQQKENETPAVANTAAVE